MTEEQLINIYNSIIKEDFELTNILLSKNLINKRRSLELVYEYGISIEDKENFIEKFKIFKEHSKNYYVIAMEGIKKYQETGEISLAYYAEIATSLTKLLSMFPKYKNIIDEIREKVNEMKREYNNSFLGGRSEKRLTYEADFYLIYISENPVDVYKNFDWNETTFNKKISCFKRNYKTKSDQELARYFEDQFRIYLEKYKKVKKQPLPFQCNNDNFQLAKSVTDDLIASGKSIYEYCHEHLEYNVLDIKRFIRIVYTEDGASKSKPVEIIKQLEQENPEFKSQLEYIAYQITSNPEFTILDYFLLTKLSLEDFKTKIEDISNTEIAIFIDKNSNYRRNKGQLRFTLENELKTNRIINGRLITDEEKKAIFKWLEENQIPIDNYTYRCCIKKLVNGDLNFIQKINVYKGSN